MSGGARWRPPSAPSVPELLRMLSAYRCGICDGVGHLAWHRASLGGHLRIACPRCGGTGSEPPEPPEPPGGK